MSIYPLTQWAKTLPAFLLLSILTMPAGAAVVGPVPVASLPGGGSVSDSDPGPGEQWGRLGGRDWTYSGIDTTQFSVLEWGPSGSGAVGIAFDGQINAGTAEELSFDAGQSNLAGGIAVWSGATTVAVTGGIANIETRFQLKLTRNNSPVPLQLSAITGLPSLDVQVQGAPFTANLQMLAREVGALNYEPALDLFDRLPTDPNQSEQAQTSFSSGFFFEALSGGLSIEEHDANMQQQTEAIEGLIEFHNLETVGRLQGLGSDHDDMNQRLNQIANDIADLSDQGGVDPDDIDRILQSLQNFQSEVFQFLWGIELDANGEPNFDNVTPISTLARTKLDLQVVQPDKSSKSGKSGKSKKGLRNMLILATENGEMVGDVNIVVVAEISDNGFVPTIIQDFYAQEIAPGLLSLEFTSSAKSAKDGGTILVITEHSDHDFGDQSHRGAILVD